MRMLTYPGTDDYSTTIVANTVDAVVKLDLNEFKFMLGLLADTTQANPAISISNYALYKGYIT